MGLCRRIEQICRYGPLTDDETSTDSTPSDDRRIVSLLYQFLRRQGESQETAEREARVYAVRLLLNTVFV